jgi:hypothetical protein
MKLHVTSTPEYVGVMWYGEGLSKGNCEASNMGASRWYLNRLKVRVPGQGHGSLLLKQLLEALSGRDDFKKLIVEPGGYGSDVGRLVKFYERQGFQAEKDYWSWTPNRERIAACPKPLETR